MLSYGKSARDVTKCMEELAKKYRLDKNQEKTLKQFVDKSQAALKESRKS